MRKKTAPFLHSLVATHHNLTSDKAVLATLERYKYLFTSYDHRLYPESTK